MSEPLLDLYRALAPVVMLLAGACGYVLAAPFLTKAPLVGDDKQSPDGTPSSGRATPSGAWNRHCWGAMSVAVFLAAWVIWSELAYGLGQNTRGLGLPFVLDRFAWLISGLALAMGLLLTLLAWNEAGDQATGEFYASLFAIIAGLMVIASANDLVPLFLGLELVSIPTYILLLIPRRDRPAQEAAAKYFLLSLFTSAFFLYGVSLIYGMVGSTNFDLIQAKLSGQTAEATPMLLALTVGLVVAGLAFRITAIPFHFYAPDIFSGVPASLAGFLSVVPKIAGFAALSRLLGDLLLPARVGEGLLGEWVLPVLVVFAAVTMLVGNLLALVQSDIRRLMAYSSVAHAGYLFAALLAGGEAGRNALLFYLVVYGLMSIGVFAIFVHLGERGRPVAQVSDLAGLARREPGLAAMLALLLFSLTGLPPAAGFWGKYFILVALLGNGNVWLLGLAITLVLAAVIGAAYYFRILATIYQVDSQPVCAPTGPRSRFDLPSLTGAIACSAMILLFFLAPRLLWQLLLVPA